MDNSEFRKQLFKWYENNNREHPWMVHHDPYKIWLYEIIMQQTRISQGTPYYNKFVHRFPTVNDLAKAGIDEVLKLWEGLGYYSRARNLHYAANQIVDTYGGKFPTNSKELQKLKGIGKYTSAAIATFAFDEKIGVVDGNVYRVLARAFGVKNPIDQTEGKKIFDNLAQELADKSQPAMYNQAIMDFGALQCTPKQANCAQCTMKKTCVAHNKNLVSALPVKSKKLIKKTRYFNYMVLEFSGQTLIRQRIKKDVWKLLYEYPYLEEIKSTPLTRPKIKKWLLKTFGYKGKFNCKKRT